MIYLTGYGSKTPQIIQKKAVEIGANVLVDIRFYNRSRKRPEWDAENLRSSLQLPCIHLPQLGDPNWKTNDNPQQKMTLSDPVKGIELLQRIEERYGNILAFCACRQQEKCHRALLAKALQTLGYPCQEIEWSVEDDTQPRDISLLHLHWKKGSLPDTISRMERFARDHPERMNPEKYNTLQSHLQKLKDADRRVRIAVQEFGPCSWGIIENYCHEHQIEKPYADIAIEYLLSEGTVVRSSVILDQGSNCSLDMFRMYYQKEIHFDDNEKNSRHRRRPDDNPQKQTGNRTSPGRTVLSPEPGTGADILPSEEDILETMADL